ncbi:serine protease 1 [Drosophila biarmipes]|uniref:serine protease 1 n=1 Tax=Drosophila biarmipes TaxID=125945 RepID=UPI0007E83413|nr:serine protease 1 [Drosophila biarmipes]
MKLVATLIIFSFLISASAKKKVRPRIAGGYRAKPYSMTYLVGILYAKSHLSKIELGAGTIISNQWVITVRDLLVYEFIEVHFGSRRPWWGYHRRKVYRNNFYFHYDKSRSIALVKVPFQKFDERLNRVRIPPFKDWRHRYVGHKTVICGWGNGKVGGKMPDWLRCAEVKPISNEECAAYYPPLKYYEMCTSGDDNKGACDGDVGGSVVSFESKLMLIGIINLRPENCSGGWPSIHIRINDHLLWIHSVSGVSL